jgi:hypothetical protein
LEGAIVGGVLADVRGHSEIPFEEAHISEIKVV